MIWCKRKFTLILSILGFTVCIFLSGCGNSGTGSGVVSVNIAGFDLNFDKNINLEQVSLKTDDLDEIIALYQEVGNNSDYRDSLLVAEKNSQGLGANKFSRDNLDILEAQGLSLNNIERTQIRFEKDLEMINAVLLEYEITEGLIESIPLLYVGQLFIPMGNNMILMSFISESKSSCLSVANSFKNIK